LVADILNDLEILDAVAVNDAPNEADAALAGAVVISDHLDKEGLAYRLDDLGEGFPALPSPGATQGIKSDASIYASAKDVGVSLTSANGGHAAWLSGESVTVFASASKSTSMPFVRLRGSSSSSYLRVWRYI